MELNVHTITAILTRLEQKRSRQHTALETTEAEIAFYTRELEGQKKGALPK